MVSRRSVLSLLLLPGLVLAQTLSGPELVNALRQGGYVILMRHANSPGAIPSREIANADNVPPERQLDQVGRDEAAAMGKALRDLRIPIGTVLSSPTYRANETVRFGQFGTAQKTPELGENGSDMQGGTAAQTAWLQKRVAQFATGTNTILVTHSPNIAAAFPGADVAQGEALVFGPDGKGGAALVARLKIGEWPGLKP